MRTMGMTEWMRTLQQQQLMEMRLRRAAVAQAEKSGGWFDRLVQSAEPLRDAGTGRTIDYLR